jgi:hypothetical protein
VNISLRTNEILNPSERKICKLDLCKYTGKESSTPLEKDCSFSDNDIPGYNWQIHYA